MKEKFKQHYLSFGPGKFVIFTVLTLLITDILNGYYFKLIWIKKNLSLILVQQSALRGGMILEDLSPDTLNEMLGFVSNIFYFFLFLILLNNLFFYFFYLRKKLWAQGYILFYTLTASLFSLSFIFSNEDVGIFWPVFNFLSIPLYVYLFLGVKLLKAETTLGDEKKEQ